MPDSVLKTVEQVVAALGGPAAVARMCGVVPSAVSNWLKEDRIAQRRFFLMSRALERKGYRAAPSLWGQTEAGGARRSG